MSNEEYHAIRNSKRKQRLYGVTHSILVPKYDFFIAIFHKEQTDRSLLSTVIHEMTHAEQVATGGPNEQSHGKHFRKIGRRLVRNVKKKQADLPKPFCDIEIDKTAVITARG